MPIVWFGCAAYALCYAALSLLRFSTFHAQIDLSYYIRIVWGLAHAQYDVPLVASPNLIGLHAEPILIPFAVLARIGLPIAQLLLITQALAVSLLPIPLYRFAKRKLGSDRVAQILSLGSLLYPTVTVATLHDFHPVTLALPSLAAFLDAIDEKALRRAFLFGFLSVCCREDIALQLALVLAACALVTSYPRWTFLGIAAALILYFAIYIVVIQPRFLPPLGSYALHFASSGAKVSSGRDLLWLMLRHPIHFAVEQLTWDRLRYVIELLWPLGFLPFLGIRYSIGILPILGINFLSTFPRVRSIESHYTTAMVPFLVASAVVGFHTAQPWLMSRLRRDVSLAAAWLLVALLAVSHLLHGASPLARLGTRYDSRLFVTAKEDAGLRAAIARIPAHASVAARPGPLAHVADRPRVISPPEYDDGRAVDVVLTKDATPAGEARIGNQSVSTDQK